MKRIFFSEFYAIAVSLFFTLLFGVVSGNWPMALIASLVGYILWLFYRLKKLEKWVARGTRMSQVYDDNGFVGIIIRHLYRQKKISSERKKRSKEILGRLNRNISALPDATVLINQYHEIEWCNEPAHYLLAIHSHNDLGQRITNLIRQPEFLLYLNDPGSRQYLDIESPIDSRITLQLKLVSFAENQYLLTARNVSEQKQIQQGLKNFVANASHELKSPLTIIGGHLEMLGAEKNLSASGSKSLSTAMNQSIRMQRLIDDLLFLSQLESYHLQPDQGESLNLNELTDSVITVLDVEPNQGRIRFEKSAPLSLLGIRLEIEGICTNLIENALKYSGAGSEVRVVWQENEQGELVVSVTDQGPGINQQDLPRITERYFRGRSTTANQIPGSGLGLSIVQQAAAKHGATLKIESQPGQGSCFKVIFPSYRRLKKEVTLAPVIRLADY